MPSINLVLNPSSFFPLDSSIQSSSSLQPDEGTVVAISELLLSFVAEMYRFLEQAACAALIFGYVVQAQNAGICPQDNGKTRTTPSGMSLAPLCIQWNLCTTSSLYSCRDSSTSQIIRSPPVLLWRLLSLFSRTYDVSLHVVTFLGGDFVVNTLTARFCGTGINTIGKGRLFLHRSYEAAKPLPLVACYQPITYT